MQRRPVKPAVQPASDYTGGTQSTHNGRTRVQAAQICSQSEWMPVQCCFQTQAHLKKKDDMEWRIVAFSHRLSLPFPRWNVGARHALFININSPGRNLAITQEYGDN